MAVSCGESHTLAVTEHGQLFQWGRGQTLIPGLGLYANQILPTLVDGPEMSGERFVMVSAGIFNSAALAYDGVVWTWGVAEFGSLGHGNGTDLSRPTRLGKEAFGGVSAVRVTCGSDVTFVLTEDGRLWSFGIGTHGKHGHGDLDDRLVPTQLGAALFGGARVVSMSTGGNHASVLTTEGDMYTFGQGEFGRLGHGGEQDILVPTMIPRELFAGSRVVMVSTGQSHSAAVTTEGALFAWGNGAGFRLGLGDNDDRLTPTRVLAPLDRSRVRMVDCGSWRTLIVTEDGLLYVCGSDLQDQPMLQIPTLVEAHHFDGAKIVAATCGPHHSAVLTQDGALYTWGYASWSYYDEVSNDLKDSPIGLGHADLLNKLMPTRVDPGPMLGARVGFCHGLHPLYVLAFAMVNHIRLGAASGFAGMPDDLMQRVVANFWQAGEGDNLVSLMDSITLNHS